MIPVSRTVLPSSHSVPTLPRLESKTGAVTSHIPPAFDARQVWQGCLSTPPNQGTCGSCWAFAAVTALQDRFCILSCAPQANKWEQLDQVQLCSKKPHVYNARNENQLFNVADQLFALKKVTIRLLFFQIKAGYSQPVSPELWSSSKPCDQVTGLLPQITSQEWLDYFTAAYHQYKTGDTAKDRTLGLTNIALMELGAPLGYYLPLSPSDTLPVAQQKIKIYFQFWDANQNGMIDLCEFEAQKEAGPIRLSIQKVITCLVTDDTLPTTLKGTVQGTVQANAACGGATLSEAWRYLRDAGTPVESCVGYTYQSWGEEPTAASVKQSLELLPMCKELLGPERNQCPGFVPQAEWNKLVSLIVHGKQQLEQDSTPQQQEADVQQLSQKLSTLEPWNQPLLIMFRALNAYSVAATVTDIQLEILQNGPVTTGFTVYDDFLNHFGSLTGGRGGQKFDGHSVLGSSATSLIYKWDGVSQSTGTAHAVVILGWGTFQNTPYWLVRNSWGLEWGTSGDSSGANGQPSELNGGGYFWFHRGDNNCGLESNVIAGLPDLAGDAFPGSVVQPKSDASLAEIQLLKPGFDCVYKSKGMLVCHELGFHGSSADYESIGGKLVPIDVTSPLAFFWPDNPEARTKRKALYNEIQSFLQKSTQVSNLKQEFDTLFAASSNNSGITTDGSGTTTDSTPRQPQTEQNLFIGLLVTVVFLSLLLLMLFLLTKKK